MIVRRWFHLGRLRWFGASLHVHLSVVIAMAVLALMAVDSPAYAIATLLSLLAVILIHELGHAAVAQYFGYSVEAIWFTLIHGRCEFEAPHSEWERVLIAWGGVAAQLLVAVPLCVLDSFWRGSLGILGPVILILGYWSLVLVMFNLLPMRDLDGRLAWRIIPLLRHRSGAKSVVRAALRRTRRGR